MVASLSWICGRIFRSLRVVDERIAHCLSIINPRINLASGVSGNAILPQSNEDLEAREDGFLLMAVPKKRTSASKKKLRNRHKWLKNRSDIETCEVCGNFKLENHLCGYCVKDVRRKTIEFRKEKNEGGYQWPIPDILRKFRT